MFHTLQETIGTIVEGAGERYEKLVIDRLKKSKLGCQEGEERKSRTTVRVVRSDSILGSIHSPLNYPPGIGT